MKSTFKIALTGGGTAGHVMPHLAMLPYLQNAGLEPYYIGSNGIEKDIVGKENISFYTIRAGKLRRYFSLQNFFDIFNIFWGFLQTLGIFIRNRPDIVFSKGGFVSVPVSVAAWILRIPVISHESDLTPGLANRIISPFSRRILYCFPQTGDFLPAVKSRCVGLPIRQELFDGNSDLVKSRFGLVDGKPTLLFMGGSLGSVKINQALRDCIDELILTWNVIHITGKGKKIDYSGEGYCSFEYVSDDLRDFFAAADIIISRAGANSIFEFLALKKPMLLIPLDAGSRGDQIQNAQCFRNENWAHLLPENELSGVTLLKAIEDLNDQRSRVLESQKKNDSGKVVQMILDEINSVIS